ncbi:UNVERIFIED_CONTAM: hypothetical protein PYX00_004509 [Menopon gallinae]|uniref:Uncharacterized protein n=1 Tax=Menopon gallinae TaxID=328185 RepID=A0AAW2I6N6_9NEOP
MSKDLPEGLAFKEDLNLYRYCNGNLNFSTASHEDEDFGYQKKKIMRDPMSHRIIEKRRRDRMNNCLADLSRLIPPDYLKKGRGRIEKTEIIEMAIKHMRHLQSIISSSRANEGPCENGAGSSPDGSSVRDFGMTTNHQPIIIEHYRLGYLECLSEAMHFLVEVQGYFAGDSLCVQMINHLHKHCDKILKSDLLNHPRKHSSETAGSNSSASPPTANYSNNSPPLGLSASNGSNSDDNQPNLPYEKTFELMEDPLRGVDFRSPRRYSDLSSRDFKKTGEGYYPRYAEPEAERVSENPSDSDMELYPGRGKEPKGYLGGYEDSLKCTDCLPRNCSSSSGIGSNPEYPPYEEFVVKEENVPSQLRDMLTSPKVVHPQEVKRSTSPTSYEQHYQSDALNYKVQAAEDPPQENGDTHGNMYKFKNNIKQRFSKERKNHESDEENSGKKPRMTEGKYLGDPLMKERLNLLNKVDDVPDSRKRARFHSESDGQSEMDISNRLSFGHKTGSKMKKWDEKFSRMKLSPLFLNPEAPIDGRKPVGLLAVAGEYPSSDQSEPSVGVPIFALHAKGSFYIPLTLDQSVLSPFLQLLGLTKSEEEDDKPVLHPVSISVNFQTPYLSRSAKPGAIAWK